MSKLQKSAWTNLIAVSMCAIVGGAGFSLLFLLNAKGIDHIFIFFIVGSLTGLGVYMFYRKKSPEAGFDEREKMINRREFSFAAMGLTIFLACVCIIPFFVLGGQNVIKVYYLPLIFISTLFAAQFVHSMAILIQCALEEEDGQ
jgi:fatty acid desaturase